MRFRRGGVGRRPVRKRRRTIAPNFRLALHLGFSLCFALSAHPLAAMSKDGKTMIVTLCSEPGVYRTIEIPLGESSPGEKGNPQNGPAGEPKACHILCCSRRTTSDDHCPA